MNGRSLIFFGSKQAGYDVCRTLIDQLPNGILLAIICPDDSADQRSVMAKFRSLADGHGVAFHVVRNVAETRKIVATYNPSVALVHGWYQILPVAEFANTLFLGFHYSPLPKYRGNAPLVWQIINGEKSLGVSFFQLTIGMDEGDLVDQHFFTLSREESISDALRKAGDLTYKMVYDFLNSWLTGAIKFTKQPSEIPSYCGLRQPEDGIIDWHRRAANVHDFVRAQSKPYPGAFSYLPDGRKLTILKTVEEERVFYGVPGGVVEVTPDHVVVACGDGAIRLVEVEIDGEVEEKPSSILRSIKIRLS